MSDTLEDIKLFKGINDDLQDKLLKLIIEESQQRILTKINLRRKDKLTTVPTEIGWIVRDVSIKRFNRIDSEGTKKHSEEGSTFDWEGYLDEYADVFSSYDDSTKVDKSKPGVIRVW